MKVFITGIEGFAGHYLARELQDAGHQVEGSFYYSPSAADLQEFELYELDLTSSAAIDTILQKSAPDIIYHLAAQSSAALSFKNPKLTYEINVIGTVNLLESLRSLAKVPRFLLISSCEVYGPSINGHPHKESDPYQPRSPYAASKAAQEIVVRQYASSYGWEVVVVRPFPHIGPGQSDTFALPSFARQLAEIEAGLKEPVIRVGNLEAKRDYCDVRDMVRAYRLLGEKGVTGETYNVCSGRSYTIGQLLQMLLSYSQVPVRLEIDPARFRPSDVPILLGDGQKLAEALGWRPKINIEDTLRDLLIYWRSKKSAEVRR